MTDGARRWSEVIREQQASGQTQRAFCEARGLNVGTFAWWKRKLRLASSGGERRRSPRRRRGHKPGFVEIRLSDQTVTNRYEITLSRGRTIRVPGGFDTEELGRLIAVVEGVC
jgi:hypothetical protein